MTEVKHIEDLLREHPFFRDIKPEFLEIIAGCAWNVNFDPDEMILKEGNEANRFYIIREGTVAVEVHSPGKGKARIQTLSGGDILGWSWLFPPYRWALDARAMAHVRAIAFDGECLRGKCEANCELGYELMKRFSQVLIKRFQHTRLQLLDVYGTQSNVTR